MIELPVRIAVGDGETRVVGWVRAEQPDDVWEQLAGLLREVAEMFDRRARLPETWQRWEQQLTAGEE